jgi:hypothetical protein
MSGTAGCRGCCLDDDTKRGTGYLIRELLVHSGFERSGTDPQAGILGDFRRLSTSAESTEPDSSRQRTNEQVVYHTDRASLSERYRIARSGRGIACHGLIQFPSP